MNSSNELQKLRKTVFLSNFRTPFGTLVLGDCKGKLCLCDWKHSPKHDLNLTRILKRTGAGFREEGTVLTDKTQKELEEYLDGQRTVFSVHPYPLGTEFELDVWRYLMAIPYGTVRTYSDIARQSGHPSAVRAVARAIALNPVSVIVPCHRVVGICNPLAYAGGREAKSHLLRLEKQLPELNKPEIS